jgi:hypothetical protein
MQSWQSSFLGLRAIPRDLSAFELNAFFTFDAAERKAIDARQPTHISWVSRCILVSYAWIVFISTNIAALILRKQ